MSGLTNPTRAAQLIDFGGMKRGTNWMTDIDGLRDYKNKAWIITEVKSGTAKMSFGQKLALERLADDLNKVKPTILIIARHTIESAKQVRLNVCLVDSYRKDGLWIRPDTLINVFDLETEWLKKEGLL